MPEYSGYVDKSTVGVNPTLDWHTVITGVRDTLVKQEADRAATRQTMAENTQKTLSDLNNINTGQSQTGNEYITKASYQAKNLTNELYKQYTSGLMSKEQFNVAKQNISGGFSDINDTMKNMQADYAKYQELSQNGELSAYSNYMQGIKGKMADLSNKTMYFEPTSGKAYIATLNEKGETDKNTLMQTSWLKNNQNFFDPRVKPEEEVAKYTGKMKEFTTMLHGIAHPGVWTINDIRNRPEYAKLTTDISKAVASTPLRTASILTDFVTDKQYSFTQDEKEAASDPNKIFLKADANGIFVPRLTDAQQADANKAIQRVIDSQLGVKEEQVEDTYHAPVRATTTATAAGKASEKLNEPTLSEPTFINKTSPTGKKYTTGTAIGVENVKIKKAQGVEEVINTFGVDDGKLFLKYTKFSGKQGFKDTATGESTTTTSKQKFTLGEDKQAAEISGKLALIPNPETGEGFKSIKEAKDYIERKKSKAAPVKTFTTSKGIQVEVQ